MIIKCWGSRGSIPVSGGEYIKYGGDTTCLEIRT
ncbi:MAG: MBL fold metallo-hydrolase, partial [Desulfobacterales bacterium]